jgi:tRNA A-37 threonylcarbamoyl transferase component Bud32
VSEPDALSPAPVLAAANLIAAGRSLPVPFRLEVNVDAHRQGAAQDAACIECVEILRLLPGRRLVARARLADTQCVLKLFVGSSARRYFQRERRGLQQLAGCAVPTPEVLACVSLPGGEGFGLVLEWLADAQPVAENDPAAFVHVVGALARLHNGSATQTDPHLDNYLATANGRVFAIDGDGVRRWPVLSRRRALANLGLLLAQYSPAADGHLATACAEYDRIRWQTSLSDVFLAEVRRHLRRQRRRRTRRYLAKTLRECTEFRCERSRDRFVVCARAAWSSAMQAFAENPEALFEAAEQVAEGSTKILKAGNSATVIRVPIGETNFVIKRYNVKSLGHGLRRALRPVPRYRRSWRNGHRLAFLRLPTARPVALVERKVAAAATVAYLVMEDLGPEVTDLVAWVAEHGATPALTQKVASLFRGIADAELVHGDTKASNFLVRDEEIYLIDLDAMVEGRRGAGRDVARFLANWEGDLETRERFRSALQVAGVPL